MKAIVKDALTNATQRRFAREDKVREYHTGK